MAEREDRQGDVGRGRQVPGVDLVHFSIMGSGSVDGPGPCVPSLATRSALPHVFHKEVAEVSQLPQPPGAVHVWPDEAVALQVVGRAVVAVVVQGLVAPAGLPVVHVGSRGRDHPPPVRGLLRCGGVDVFSR